MLNSLKNIEYADYFSFSHKNKMPFSCFLIEHRLCYTYAYLSKQFPPKILEILLSLSISKALETKKNTNKIINKYFVNIVLKNRKSKIK